MHHGSVLREFLSVRGIKQSSASRQLGIHVNTLRNWMGMEKLDARSLNLLLVNWPELRSVLPRPVTSQYAISSGVSASLSEPAAAYGSSVIDGRDRSSMLADEFSERYMRLLERYAELLEKHLEAIRRLNTV